MQLTLEEYLLACLAEECAEVIQRVTKAQRFGLEEVQESNLEETRNNRQRIGYELNDLRTVYKLLETLHPDYSIDLVQRGLKRQKLFKYMAYSIKRGTLDGDDYEFPVDYVPDPADITPEHAACVIAALTDPQTDREREAALAQLGVEVVGGGADRFMTYCSKGGGQTTLEAQDYSSALREAWNLYKD